MERRVRHLGGEGVGGVDRAYHLKRAPWNPSELRSVPPTDASAEVHDICQTWRWVCVGRWQRGISRGNIARGEGGIGEVSTGHTIVLA
eukprot:2065498-Rhodomonas_salina.2